MADIFIYTIFNKNGTPRKTGIKFNNTIIIESLFNNTNKTIKQIFDKIKSISKLLSSNNRIIISDYKEHISGFKLFIDNDRITNSKRNIYDLKLPKIKLNDDNDDNIKLILDKMSKIELKPYHKIIANSSIVYQWLEDNGLLMNYDLVHPKWSLDTFSGRSKSTNFNIQGITDNEHIRTIFSNDKDILIHFDWVCADIRIASILSGDKKLQDTFILSDPYTAMSEILQLPRDMCKELLLRSVNSVDIGNDVFHIFEGLGKWIEYCYKTIQSNQTLYTILGRKFSRANATNDLGILNGIMQGSVAHAMQLSIYEIWNILPCNLIAEIHDSLIVCCPNNPSKIEAMINMISNIMIQPFNNILDSNPIFPIKVSIGKKWRQWKLLKVIRHVQ